MLPKSVPERPVGDFEPHAEAKQSNNADQLMSCFDIILTDSDKLEMNVLEKFIELFPIGDLFQPSRNPEVVGVEIPKSIS